MWPASAGDLEVFIGCRAASTAVGSDEVVCEQRRSNQETSRSPRGEPGAVISAAVPWSWPKVTKPLRPGHWWMSEGALQTAIARLSWRTASARARKLEIWLST